MENVRKTYTLSAGLVEKVERLQDEAQKLDLNLSESTIVRLALTRGLPLAAESLGLEVTSQDGRPELATV